MRLFGTSCHQFHEKGGILVYIAIMVNIDDNILHTGRLIYVEYWSGFWASDRLGRSRRGLGRRVNLQPNIRPEET